MTHRHPRPALLAVTTAVVALVTAVATTVAPATAEPRIAGGSAASSAAYPWEAELLLGYPDDSTSECGGALVAPTLVLTNADCLDGVDAIQVVLGADQRGGGAMINAAVARPAPGHNPDTLDNDYGLVVLSTPFTLLQPIKIAGPGEGATWRPGRTGVVTGFGRVSENGQSSPTLQAVQAPVQPDSVCGAAGSYGTNYRPASQLCAGRVEGGSGACPGDEGGPLAVPVDGGYRLAGVYIGAAGCGRPNLPGIYTKIGDPAVGAAIQQLATDLATDYPQYFPGVYANPQLLGSGAVPAGCGAARGAAAAAAGAVAGPAAGQAAANAALAKATKTLKKAKKSRVKAKIAKAKKKQKSAKSAVASAGAAVGAAQAQAAAAAGGANAACS